METNGNGTRLKWWEESVDEIAIGMCIGAVAVFAIVWLGEASTAIASAAVTALGVYLGARTKKA